MTANELNKNLNEVLDRFSQTTHAMFEEADQTPATKNDLFNLSRETFYALNDFRKEIIAYLDKQS